MIGTYSGNRLSISAHMLSSQDTIAVSLTSYGEHIVSHNTHLSLEDARALVRCLEEALGVRFPCCGAATFGDHKVSVEKGGCSHQILMEQLDEKEVAA